jgi:minor extracellular serine protease Vpr
MRYRRTILAALAALALTASNVLAAAPPASTDATTAGADLDTSSAIVVLKQAPVATYDGHVPGYAKTRPDKGKINPNSAAAKKYLGYLKAEHSEFAKWLQQNVPSAKITSEFYTVLNGVAVKLNGNAIGKLANNTDVLVVEYNALYRPTMSQSYKVINASGAWAEASGGRAGAGAGVKVGIIDTGIDKTHPFFDPAGFSYPSGFPKCDATDSATNTADSACKYVSPKVIVAKVFTNKQNQNGFDAEAVQDHGTHVAGTVAGVTGKTAIINGVSIGDLSGVAPGAWLGNYNVFPGSITNARSEDILNAVDAAVDDGMDVLNLSLGGGYRGNNDLLAMGLDNTVDAGVVVAVAAGNSGPGGNTVESPGRARNILTAGASTNQHFVGQPFTYPASGGTTVGVAVGEFPALPSATYTLFDTGNTGCTSVLGSAAGKLAIITRGGCTFSTKVRNATTAGATAVLVVNNVAGDPTAMAKDGLGGDGLPAVMIGLAEGAALRTSIGAGTTDAVATATFSEFITAYKDILAGFSSQGPTSVDMAIKPDLTSVGVNVLSSTSCVANPSATCGGEGTWAFFSGTSMATPHIAGSAAVLRGLHPTWSPAQIKSALVNTADRVIKNAKTGTLGVGPMAQGAGRENLTAAADATLAITPVSASFGKVNASNNNPTGYTLTLWNLTGSDQTFGLSATKFTPDTSPSLIPYNAGSTSAGDGRISFPTSVTVPASGSAQITVLVNAGAVKGSVIQGWITLDGTSDYHFAYWAEVAP